MEHNLPSYSIVKTLRQLFIPYILIFVILVLAVTFHIKIARVQDADSIRINLSGRQRMLTQKMTKETMQYSLNIIEKEDVLLTMQVFEETLMALTHGGVAPLDLKISETTVLPDMKTRETKEQLLKVIKLWWPIKLNITKFLETKDSVAFNFVMRKNVEILTEMDRSVFMMQYSGESNNRNINILLYFTYFLILIILLFLLKRKLILLKAANVHIHQLESILPICSSCKKIREPDSDPKDENSWVRVEQYIEERSESHFSHSVCPTCAEELYGDILSE